MGVEKIGQQNKKREQKTGKGGEERKIETKGLGDRNKTQKLLQNNLNELITTDKNILQK